jgi:hypothetical protein
MLVDRKALSRKARTQCTVNNVKTAVAFAKQLPTHIGSGKCVFQAHTANPVQFGVIANFALAMEEPN